ncbi:unnamed protein product [Didymodactylos carnosus]|uniref:Uncharacterized protein n=1 Tax=Didymodactylos carnosus TaxID=1234261 RepID=A0A815VPQ5_9BILA|nr:unnamed protein product [Didymodactylos carnosus]CAF1534847.1 unnamed protein product [Didymodactylos carnosus]CAF3578946.1 unnamed protein product [Didymodactylos carnosus]CAF4394554.1 unnamed protein product [Didymodactylos carnosus]
MTDIDRCLFNDNSKFCSIFKLFIIKQMLYMSNTTLNELGIHFKHRDVEWIKSIIVKEKEEEELKNIILPLSISDYKNEFIHVNRLLTKQHSMEELKNLIIDCCTNIGLTYCFYVWFLQSYACFYTIDKKIDDELIELLTTNELKTEIVEHFGSVGYKFILDLSTNFNHHQISYFR